MCVCHVCYGLCCCGCNIVRCRVLCCAACCHVWCRLPCLRYERFHAWSTLNEVSCANVIRVLQVNRRETRRCRSGRCRRSATRGTSPSRQRSRSRPATRTRCSSRTMARSSLGDSVRRPTTSPSILSPKCCRSEAMPLPAHNIIPAASSSPIDAVGSSARCKQTDGTTAAIPQARWVRAARATSTTCISRLRCVCLNPSATRP